MSSLNWAKIEYNFSNVLLILRVKYFYNPLRFKVVIDKSCRGHFFPDTVYIDQCEWLPISQTATICAVPAVNWFEPGWQRFTSLAEVWTLWVLSRCHGVPCDKRCNISWYKSSEQKVLWTETRLENESLHVQCDSLYYCDWCIVEIQLLWKWFWFYFIISHKQTITAGSLSIIAKARFPLPELTGDRFPLPVNTVRVDGRAFPLAELTYGPCWTVNSGSGNRALDSGHRV